tara:strand:+ start:84 stop:464 length:381 start_codon:yes stop_codon:yes gene_type:complete
MDAIQISWGDDDFVIDADEAFELGEKIEDILTLAELSRMKSVPRFNKLARCYSIMINHAGGHATPREVHTAMMDGVKNGKPEVTRQIVADAASALIAVLMDGAPTIDPDDVEDDGKKTSHSSEAAT